MISRNKCINTYTYKSIHSNFSCCQLTLFQTPRIEYKLFHKLKYIEKFLLDYFTSIPKLFAVPISDFSTDSLLLVFITGSLISIISSKSALESVATLFLFGSHDHTLIFAFHLIRSELKGGWITISYDLSTNTVISTGTFTLNPAYACIVSIVLSLNSFTKEPILIPCCHKIGPTGGAGVAFQAIIWRVNLTWTFFDMIVL